MKLNLHFTEHEKDQDEDQVISFTKRQNRTTTRNKSKTVIHDEEEEKEQQQQFLNDDPSLHGLLTQEEADISETALEEEDYKLYEMSLKNTLPPTFSHNSQSRTSTSTSSSTGGKGKDLFKLLKSRANNHNNSKSSSSSASSIRKVYFGTNVSITPWYSAPYPSEYHGSSGELWICEFCLKYMKRPEEARRHLLKCNCRLPPGDEIYRDAKAGISVFEINGRDSKLYCQNLCLLAKMFLDHKTLYYYVDPFLFYVLIEWKQLTTSPSQNNNNNNNRFTYSFVGYFSKEKVNPAGFNVSCILTMPHHQRKGYGSFLIDFSYLLSRREGKLGSPEKPLSDLGLFSYVSYWKNKLISYFATYLTNYRTTEKQPLTVETICTATGMTENDILSTLEYLKMLRFDVIKPPENNNNTSTNLHPVLKASIVLDLVIIENYQIKMRLRGGSGGQLEAKDEFLRWHPFKCTR